MSLKKFFIFGFILSCIYPAHAYVVEQDQTNPAETSEKENKVFCEYNMGDWYGYAKYDSKADVIHIQRCTWGMGYSCSEYDIKKLVEQDGIKLYYSRNDEFFIKDNNNTEFEGGWHWKSDCEGGGYSQYGLTKYAFTYTCPYTPPKNPKQLLVIDKQDKVYAVNISEKTVKVFSSSDNPIFYDDYKALSVNKTLCEEHKRFKLF